MTALLRVKSVYLAAKDATDTVCGSRKLLLSYSISLGHPQAQGCLVQVLKCKMDLYGVETLPYMTHTVLLTLSERKNLKRGSLCELRLNKHMLASLNGTRHIVMMKFSCVILCTHYSAPRLREEQQAR